ncbi:MAG: hypothetical protein D6753_13415 [Planctomycetota bacterium]|nr:MAG: hypothetical protein D6753_13415 [Planctomycetota bacterium]
MNAHRHRQEKRSVRLCTSRVGTGIAPLDSKPKLHTELLNGLPAPVVNAGLCLTEENENCDSVAGCQP